MRVLITGATGFTGGHLARALLRRGYEVVALVRDDKRAESLRQDGIRTVLGDLTQRADVQRAMSDCDAVYHIAALYREARHPAEMYYAVNVGGTRHIVDEAERQGVNRVIHCSTVGVHGDVSVPANETAPFAPGDIYQETKLQGELVVAERIARGFPGVIFRPVGIYGPGDMRFLKLFRSVARGTFRMIGSGKIFYHMTYIDDLVAGIILCGEHQSAIGETYILCGPRYTTLNELVAAVAQAVGRPVPVGRIPLAPVALAARLCEIFCMPFGLEPPLHPRRLDFFAKDRGFSSDKAHREIGYAPTVELAAGFERTANWYRSTGLL